MDQQDRDRALRERYRELREKHRELKDKIAVVEGKLAQETARLEASKYQNQIVLDKLADVRNEYMLHGGDIISAAAGISKEDEDDLVHEMHVSLDEVFDDLKAHGALMLSPPSDEDPDQTAEDEESESDDEHDSGFGDEGTLRQRRDALRRTSSQRRQEMELQEADFLAATPVLCQRGHSRGNGAVRIAHRFRISPGYTFEELKYNVCVYLGLKKRKQQEAFELYNPVLQTTWQDTQEVRSQLSKLLRETSVDVEDALELREGAIFIELRKRVTDSAYLHLDEPNKASKGAAAQQRAAGRHSTVSVDEFLELQRDVLDEVVGQREARTYKRKTLLRGSFWLVLIFGMLGELTVNINDHAYHTVRTLRPRRLRPRRLQPRRLRPRLRPPLHVVAHRMRQELAMWTQEPA